MGRIEGDKRDEMRLKYNSGELKLNPSTEDSFERHNAGHGDHGRHRSEDYEDEDEDDQIEDRRKGSEQNTLVKIK